MRLDNFIKRPVLSTVISILTVILGLVQRVFLEILPFSACLERF